MQISNGYLVGQAPAMAAVGTTVATAAGSTRQSADRPVRFVPGRLLARLGLSAWLLVAPAAFAGAVDQDVATAPPHWPAGMYERFDAYNRSFGGEKPVGRGKTGIVIGIQSALGVGAALRALQVGGNAMDAALTGALAQVAVQGGYGSSFAGWMTLIYYDAGSGELHTMNAAMNRVLGETDPLTIPPPGASNGRGVQVPGFMAGVRSAHDRFGSLPWPVLFEPAIHFAEAGFAMQSRLAGMIRDRAGVLAKRPDWSSVFLKAGGEPYRTGETFRQPALAQTLRKVADRGAGYMYGGEWAQAFVDAVQREGGKLTMADLARYEVLWQRPATAEYGGHTVATLGPPNWGGLATLEMLRLLDEAGLGRGTHYASDARTLREFIRISRIHAVLGTLDMGGEVPDRVVATWFPELDRSPARRLTPEWARSVRSLMESDAWPEYERSAAAGILETRSIWSSYFDILKESDAEASRPQRSDIVIAVDAAGNVACLLHTIDAIAWGFGLMVGGVSVGDSGSFQQHAIAATPAGGRIAETSTPILALKAGRPAFAFNLVGSWLPPTAAMHVYNTLVHGMSPQESLHAGEIWRIEPERNRLTQLIAEGAFDPELIEAVRRSPLDIEIRPAAEHYGRSSYTGILAIDPDSGALTGAISPAFNGAAEGY